MDGTKETALPNPCTSGLMNWLKGDRLTALERGRGCGLPHLTRKLWVTDACWQRKTPVCLVASHQVYEQYFREGSMPKSSWAKQTNKKLNNISVDFLSHIFSFACTFCCCCSIGVLLVYFYLCLSCSCVCCVFCFCCCCFGEKNNTKNIKLGR